jgi:hypothetical protein
MRDPDRTTLVPAGSSAPLAPAGRQGKQIRHGVGFADDDGGARALAWWDEAVPIAGTPAERYVRETRRLVLPPPVSPRAAVSRGLPVRRRPPSLPTGALSRHPHGRAAGDHADRAHAGCPQDRPQSVLSGPRRRRSRSATTLTMGLHIGEGLETTVTGMQLGLARPGYSARPARPHVPGARRHRGADDLHRGRRRQQQPARSGSAQAGGLAARLLTACPRPAMNSTMH